MVVEFPYFFSLHDDDICERPSNHRISSDHRIIFYYLLTSILLWQLLTRSKNHGSQIFNKNDLNRKQSDRDHITILSSLSQNYDSRRILTKTTFPSIEILSYRISSDNTKTLPKRRPYDFDMISI
jgi:hypothetical protein